MWRRLKIVLFVLLALVAVWLLGDFIYSCYVAHHIRKREATVERDADGVEVGCREYTVGSGSTAILLVHGINDSPACYHKVAPALAEQGFTCRVMRMPGFAKPIPEYAKATRHQWVSAVNNEVKALRQDHDRVVIVAHSLGAAVTIAYLLENPDAVDAVVLIAPAVEVSNLRSPLLPARAWHEISQWILPSTTVAYSPFPGDCHDEKALEYPGRIPFTPKTTADETFALIDFNRGRAADLQLPLMMVLSKDDRVIDWQAAERFYEEALGEEKEVHFLEDSGHVIPVDFDWKILVQKIAEFAQPVNRDRARVTFWPPKPKLLLSARSIFASRGSLGT
jgi:carboxylesterase